MRYFHCPLGFGGAIAAPPLNSPVRRTMRFHSATLLASISLTMFFAVVARDVLSESPIHATGGSYLLALLGFVVGLVQLEMVAGRLQNVCNGAYVAGLVSHVVYNDVYWVNGPPWDWRWAYVPIGVMTLAVAGVLVSAHRITGSSGMAARIYIIGGLIVCTGHLVLLIVAGAFALGFGGIAGYNIATFWYPVALVFAMASVCFGLLPDAVRPSFAVSVSYVIGAAVLSSGTLWAANDSQVTPPTYVAMFVGLVLLLPSFGVSVAKLLRRKPASREEVV